MSDKNTVIFFAKYLKDGFQRASLAKRLNVLFIDLALLKKFLEIRQRNIDDPMNWILGLILIGIALLLHFGLSYFEFKGSEMKWGKENEPSANKALSDVVFWTALLAVDVIIIGNLLRTYI